MKRRQLKRAAAGALIPFLLLLSGCGQSSQAAAATSASTAQEILGWEPIPTENAGTEEAVSETGAAGEGADAAASDAAEAGITESSAGDTTEPAEAATADTEQSTESGTEADSAAADTVAADSQAQVQVDGGSIPVTGDDPALTELMQNFMAGHGLNSLNFAVACRDLTTGSTFYFNELKQWDACSTYKLPLNLLYYDMQAAGEISGDSIIPGTGTPLSECHHQSLEFSNNPLSEAMMDNLGSYDQVKRRMRKYFTLSDAETDDSYYHHNYFCARQMMDCVQYLYNHQSDYQEALGYLEAAQPGQYFRRYISGVTIAQKYGLRDGYTHNAGIVFGEHPFVLSVYSYQAGGEDMIGQCAKAVYDYLAEQ